MAHVVVIKTDAYAGNFERELGAYLTGHVGECEVGSEYVDEQTQELFDDYIADKADDHGVFRPVGLGCDIPKYSANDVVIYLQKPLTDVQIAALLDKTKSFVTKYTSMESWNNPFEILGVDLVEIGDSITNSRSLM